MVDLVTAIRSVRAEMNIPPATLTPLIVAGVSTESKGRAQRWNDVIKRMARLSDISFADAAPEGAVQLLVRGEIAALPLKGLIDLSAEKARLDKELAKADADIKRVDAKLSNEKFVANAPEDVVEEEKEKARGGRGAEGENPRGAGAAEERCVTGRIGMRIFLAGANGVIGRRLAALLGDARHEVAGTTRTRAKAPMLEASA